MRIGMQRLFRPLALLPGLALVLATGCGQAGESAGDGPVADPDAPVSTRGDDGASYYVDQMVERLAAGRNTEREGYLAQLDACRESGAPVNALGEEDVERIGTERWRMWRDGRRFAYRIDRWSATQPPTPTRETMCTFTLEASGLHGYADATRTLTVDLGTGERTDGEGDANAPLTRADDAGTDVAELEIARKLGMQGPARQSAAGQPCDRWQVPGGGSVCIWAGGAAWGIGSIADGPFAAVDGPDPDHIVIEATPSPGGNGDRIETKAFVVGAPLDETDMMPNVR